LSILILKIIALLSLAVFLIALVVKIVKYARLPLHVRWELYPIGYGRETEGSYLENTGWWRHKRKNNFFKETGFILSELLLFRSYFHLQRKYWYSLLPFHIGLFLLVAWVVLLLLASFIMPGSDLNNVLFILMAIAGGLGFLLAAAGCIGLLVQKANDENRRIYASRMDYFTLSFILVTLLSGLFVWAFNFSSLEQYAGFIDGSSGVMVPAVFINILLLSLLLLYLPLTRTLHYVAKYFTYHNLRWDDKPSKKGGRLEKQAVELLEYPLAWASPHINKDKTWKENAGSSGKTE